MENIHIIEDTAANRKIPLESKKQFLDLISGCNIHTESS